jgi:glycosyltransferase involved in cell wall biosynthesis
MPDDSLQEELSLPPSLAFVLPQLDPKGGQQRQALNLAKLLCKNLNVSVYALKADDLSLKEEFLQAGCRVFITPSSHELPMLTARGIARSMHSLIPELVLVWNPFYGNEWALHGLREAGKKSILCVQNVLSRELDDLPAGAKHDVAEAISLAHGYIACSAVVAHDMIANFNVPEEHIRVINNIGPIPDKNPAFADPPITRIIQVGRICPQKNNLLFLDLAASVVKDYPNIEFVIVGEESDKDYGKAVSNRIKEKMLTTHFRITGWTNDARRWYRNSTIVVSTSDFEGSSLALREAMACGSCIVATDVGDARETLGEAGIVVDRGDVEALTSAVSMLLNDRHKRLMARKRSWNAYKGIYSPELYMKNFYKAITELNHLPLKNGSKAVACTQEMEKVRWVWVSCQALVIYGAGQDAKKIIKWTKNQSEAPPVVSVWDDLSMNETFEGVPVTRPGPLQEGVVVLVGSSAFEAKICNNLNKMGLVHQLDFLCLSDLVLLFASSPVFVEEAVT